MDPSTPGPDPVDLLEQFLTRNKVGRDAAAEALRTTRTTLYYWLTHRTVPSEQAKLDIETWTGGEVPASAWPVKERRGFDPETTDQVKPFSPTGTDGSHGR